MSSTTQPLRLPRAAAGFGPGAGPPPVRPTEVIGTDRAVCLTFDDGPHPEHTLRLLDVLAAQQVRAVFFLQGNHVIEHPEVVRRIVAAGHALGNHGMRHDDMGTWTAGRIASDLLETNAVIRHAVPHARIPYFRAPYGAWGQTPSVATALGMRPMGWRLAVTDWEPPGTDELLRRITEGVAPGAVVLLHDGGGDRSQTVDAVERAIPVLRAHSWRFALPDGD
ncbi:Peptidoglycan/xylan/chitin deacetylase, PgdA/CDA1 family [Micromonospora phaseoli]|uniref:Peptidoglycan/xylan/chitin deacetylase, PgdA/CDA1 family n=1 Tax=Micromonospora phaseoli TaxID=1144548 RepID=A0A1H6RYQ6_9ACTN|nr:polysaccharide deacetylase family protein [Micromonospora phaseoli]PZW03724.1 peptidoglycan/xylan/chitin deacetylase (PgdA/CDA1 family) [Micromonospora phaseoli]GIJ80291.1 chitooligosaccharide deacetylase NodB [Micromonospora phaseoli]SEI60811.1 Peptidoglycan/xylan/chitin deacetylase, PgdA/CDA1 family [Micromonospora phaseoli]